jgi:hypothetical protein
MMLQMTVPGRAIRCFAGLHHARSLRPATPAALGLANSSHHEVDEAAQLERQLAAARVSESLRGDP